MSLFILILFYRMLGRLSLAFKDVERSRQISPAADWRQDYMAFFFAAAAWDWERKSFYLYRVAGPGFFGRTQQVRDWELRNLQLGLLFPPRVSLAAVYIVEPLLLLSLTASRTFIPIDRFFFLSQWAGLLLHTCCDDQSPTSSFQMIRSRTCASPLLVSSSQVLYINFTYSINIQARLFFCRRWQIKKQLRLRRPRKSHFFPPLFLPWQHTVPHGPVVVFPRQFYIATVSIPSFLYTHTFDSFLDDVRNLPITD